MAVDPENPRGGTALYLGKTYYFCNEGCRKKFEADPAKFQTKAVIAKPPLESTVNLVPYFCPMHPEVRQLGPGSCPKCGMSLEPAQALPKDARDPHLDELRRAFMWGVALSTATMILAMAPLLMHNPAARLLQLLFGTLGLYTTGRPFLKKFVDSIQFRSFNMFTLIGIGVLSAYGASVLQLLGLFDSKHLYFESELVILTLLALGQMAEHKARSYAQQSIQSLFESIPERAIVLEKRPDGAAGFVEVEKDVAEVAIGDRVFVRPGEKIPLDSKVVGGRSNLDSSSLTGEPLPIEVSPGDTVYAGTMNLQGVLTLEVLKPSHLSKAQEIQKLVLDSQRTQAPIQLLADRVSAWFVPAVIAVAVLTFVIWAWRGRFDLGLWNAVSVFLVACPCALGLATPMAVQRASALAARKGILVKDAGVFERSASADTALFDKTGTLTVGKPQAKLTWSAIPEDAVLNLASSLAHQSTHPLSRALAALSPNRKEVTDFHSWPGLGVSGTIDGQQIYLGSARLLREKTAAQIPPGAPPSTTVYLSSQEKLLGVFSILDSMRTNAAETLNELRLLGLHLGLASGDQEGPVKEVASQLAITDFRFAVLPDDKLRWVDELQKQGNRVLFVGDGINDAPALSRAHLGVALENGSELSKQSGRVILLNGNLSGLTELIHLSRRTLSIMKQNLFMAFVYNLVAVPVASGLLNFFGHELLSPTWAAAAMSLSSIAVILNSLRI